VSAVRKCARVLAPGALPFAWAVLFACFAVPYRLLGFPPPDEFVAITQDLLNRYGLILLPAAAFIEGLFMISVYFPGSLVIAVAVFLSDKSVLSLVIIGALTWAGFVAALPIDYWLGREGFYRGLLWMGRRDVIENMENWLLRRGRSALFWASFHPTFLSVAIVCTGIAQRGLRNSVAPAALFLIPWISLIIAILAFVTKQVDIRDQNQTWVFIAILILWGVVLVVRSRLRGNGRMSRDSGPVP
jgi:membrane protein DedA with SNARE-associated domain